MKLFKKVMASVLAGVLALSMVACGTVVEPELPDDPGKEPINNAQAAVLELVNYGKKDDVITGEKTVKTDANATKVANIILETMAKVSTNGGVDGGSVWSKTEGKFKLSTKTFKEKMNLAGLNASEYRVYTLSGAMVQSWDNYQDLKDFKYDLSTDKAKAAAYTALKGMNINPATNVIGVASKVIGDVEYAVIVVTDVK